MGGIVKQVDPSQIPEASLHDAFKVGEEMRECTSSPDLPPGQVELLLPDNRLMRMGKPPGATAFKISSILKEDVTGLSATYLKALLYIRSIDGQDSPPINNYVDAQALANRIGDDGLDVALSALLEFWPGVQRNQLQVVKKNL